MLTHYITRSHLRYYAPALVLAIAAIAAADGNEGRVQCKCRCDVVVAESRVAYDGKCDPAIRNCEWRDPDRGTIYVGNLVGCTSVVSLEVEALRLADGADQPTGSVEE